MFIWTLKFDRKNVIFAIIMVALVLIGIIMLMGIDSPPPQTSDKNIKATDATGRIEYLKSMGWEVEEQPLKEQNVLIPKTFSKVFEEYNTLQLSQGFALSKYAGKELKLYTYKILNHESDENVMAELYVYKNKVVGGDIHSSALDGFMTGLKKE